MAVPACKQFLGLLGGFRLDTPFLQSRDMHRGVKGFELVGRGMCIIGLRIISSR
jgi:hypothetical protein